MAQELEVKVDSNKYSARIAMLEGYVTTLEGLVTDYTNMKNRVSDFLGESDDHLFDAQQNVELRIGRVRKAIEATQASISTLRKTMENMDNLGQNVSTLLQEGIGTATAGLFD